MHLPSRPRYDEYDNGTRHVEDYRFAGLALADSEPDLPIVHAGFEDDLR